MTTTNTLKHISDKSEYKTFDPTGTAFPSTVTNVQEALGSLNKIALDGYIPASSETTAGLIRLATTQEVIDGISPDSAVTPATLKARLDIPTQATETYVGITRYATNAEAIAGTVTDAAIVPSSLKATIDDVFTVRVGTENNLGVLRISTEDAALAGTDDTTAMSPLKVALAIGKATAALPTYSTATQTVSGLVRIATNAEVQAGTLGDGVAISPAGLNARTATQDRTGIIRLGNQSEINNSADGVAVTGATLNGRGATTDIRGVVRLTTQAGVAPGGDGAGALAWNADVINTRGGQRINGSLSLDYISTGNFDSNTAHMGGQLLSTQRYASERVPVGTVMMFAGDSAPPGWIMCHGGTVNGDQFPDYRNTVGTRFGGDWTNVGIPDMRGLFVRGAGTGGHILNNRGQDGYGKDRLGVGCDGSWVGGVQAQQMSYHKHAGGWGEYQRNEAPFGASVYQGYLGTRKYADWDNASYFTNDGFELGGGRDALGTLNREGLIGYETRPWNMSLNYIIKIHY
ncbi:tail fibers protein [Escherichia phage PSD2001]|nr:tail fibers protein [Escherichia phage PSD2001]